MPYFDDTLPALGFPMEYNTLNVQCDDADPLPFTLKINGTTILNTTLYPDETYMVTVSDLATFLQENLPKQRASEVTFKFDDLEETVKVIPSKTDFFNDGETFLTSHFLTLANGAKPTYLGTAEYISWYLATNETPSITCLWVNPDTGDTLETTEQNFANTHHVGGLHTCYFKPYNFTSPSDDFVLVSFSVILGNRKQEYIIQTPTDCEPLTLRFVNNFGLHEMFHFFGTYEKELKPTRSTASFSGKTRNYKVDAVPTWKCETGILSEAVQPLFADLCSAEQVWRTDNDAEVTITENEYKIANDRYEPQSGTLTFRESSRSSVHKSNEKVSTFDQTFDNTFD